MNTSRPVSSTPKTPVKRILHFLRGQPAQVFESNGSPILSPSQGLNENPLDQVVKELEQSIEQLKADNSTLRADIDFEQESRYKAEDLIKTKDAQIQQLKQDLLRYKQELAYLREENDLKVNVQIQCEEITKKNRLLEGKLLSCNARLEELEIKHKHSSEEVETLVKEKYQYVSNIAALKCKIEEAEANCLELENQVVHKNQELLAYADKVKSLEEEKSALFKELTSNKLLDETMNMTPASPGECMSVITDLKIKELEEEINILKETWLNPQQRKEQEKELQSLNEELHSQKKKFSNLEAVIKQHEEIKEENVKLHCQLEMSKSKVNNLNDQVTLLKETWMNPKRSQELHRDIQNLTEELHLQKDKCAHLETVVKQQEAVKNENIQLDRDLKASERQIRDLTNEVNILRESWFDPQRCQELNEENQNLNKELHLQREKCTDFETVAKAQEAVKEENVRLNGQLRTSECKIHDLTADINRLEATWLNPQRSQELEKEIQKLNEELHSHKAKYTDLHLVLKQEKEENVKLNCQFKASQSKINGLADEINTLKAAWLDPQRSQELENDIQRLKEELHLQKAKCSNLEISAEQHAEEVAKLDHHLKSECQKKCQEFENLKSLHEHLEEEKLNLFKQLQKVERKAKESESSYLTLQSVNVTLDAQISDFQKRHDNLTQDNLNKEKQIKVLNSQKETLECELSSLATTLSKMSSQVNTLDGVYKSLQNDNNRLKLDKESLEMELSKVMTELQTYRQLLDSPAMRSCKRDSASADSIASTIHDLIHKDSTLTSSHLSASVRNRSHISVETSLLADKDSSANFDLSKSNSVCTRPSSLGLPTIAEEPDAPKDWYPLERIAELQNRNKKQHPHLKSSYPVETQGLTPRRCDETVRIGDPRNTLKRINETGETFSIGNITGRGSFDAQSPPLRKGDPSNCGEVVVQEVKPSTAFEIPNTPAKKTAKRPPPNKRVAAPTGRQNEPTVKKSKLASSIDQRRKPFGRLNSRK